MILRLGSEWDEIETGSLQTGSLQPWATDFGSGNALTWESTLWEFTISGHRFWIWKRAYLGVCTLEVYNLGPPILDLETSLLRNLHSGGLQTGGLESRATDFGSGIVLTWESTLWGSTNK